MITIKAERVQKGMIEISIILQLTLTHKQWTSADASLFFSNTGTCAVTQYTRTPIHYTIYNVMLVCHKMTFCLRYSFI